MKAASFLLMTALILTGTMAAAAPQAAKTQVLLNANVATEKELLTLPHLNATVAKGIVGRRPFKSMVDLNSYLAATLNKEQLTALYGRLFVPVNLNTATREEILLIPGVGRRLAHEFEEYRPYKTIEQFRKEIGKYVSKEEVARLERYLTLK